MCKSRLHHLLAYDEKQSLLARNSHFYFLRLWGGLKILMESTQHSAWYTAAAQSVQDVLPPSGPLTQLQRCSFRSSY